MTITISKTEGGLSGDSNTVDLPEHVREQLEICFHNIRIRPTSHGYAFILFLVLLLFSAIYYLNSIAFILCFLLISLLHNVFWLSYRNIQGLQIMPCATESVFSKQTAYFHFIVFNAEHYEREAIAIQWQNGPISFADIAANCYVEFSVRVPTKHRGYLKPESFQFFSCYPLALLECRCEFDFQQGVIIYPHPANQYPSVQSVQQSSRQKSHLSQGQDDFYQLRSYQAGDSLKHIAWKQSTKFDHYYTKEFQGEISDEIYSVNWEQSAHHGEKHCLAILTAQILDISTNDKPYELHLPYIHVSAGTGLAHRHRCLTELALCKIESENEGVSDRSNIIGLIELKQ